LYGKGNKNRIRRVASGRTRPNSRVHTALQQNYDVRIAATRVLEAQAQLGITRANQFPSAIFGASVFSEQNAKVSNLFPVYEVNAGQLNLSVIWNLDFWGKYRRQTEAARAQMLATEWGQRAVVSSLVANVATAYFQLRTLDSELDIAKRTLGSRQQSLQLTQVLETHGSASDPDVSQSEQLVYTASETIPDLERQIEQQENLLSILLGENPGSVPGGRALTEQPVPMPFLLACRQNCYSVGRTSIRPKKSSLRPPRKLAWLRLRFSRAFPSPGRVG
jgi:outer membrane protein, multidrug efflux system